MSQPRKLRWAEIATHAFLLFFTAVVLFPILKVFQISLQDRQTFDMRINLLPSPALFTLKNFGQVIGRTRSVGLGPELATEDLDALVPFLASLTHPPLTPAPSPPGPGFVGPPLPPAPLAMPEAMAKRLASKRCLSCHRLGALGQQDGLGGDLQIWPRRSAATLRAWLERPTRDNAQALGLRDHPTGMMAQRTEWLFGRQLGNSAVVALFTMMLGIFLSCTAAYAFSRFRFPGRRSGLLAFLVIQMFPGAMMLIPLYILLQKLGLLDHLLGLVLIYSTTSIPFCVWTLKGFFDTIPRELEEAAIMDGASHLRIFWVIVLPLARPAIAVTGLFSFMGAWNEFILAATLMNDEAHTTLPVMLNSFVSSHTIEWGHFAAGAILVSLPVVTLFFLLQRHLVSGLTAGGVKG